MATKRTRETPPIDITPLIDVIFLLLVFFMVSSVFRKDQFALLLNLPKTAHADPSESQNQTLNIELNAKEVAINGQKLEIQEMDKKLEEIKDKSIAINMRVDKDVRYEVLISVLEKLKIYQLNNLSLITEK